MKNYIITPFISFLLFLLINSCSTVDFIKAYSSLNTDRNFKDQIFNKRDITYKVGDLNQGWQLLDLEYGDLAFYNKSWTSTININSTCDSTKSYKLTMLSDSLLNGLQNKKLIERSKSKFTDFHLQVAEQLGTHIKSTKQINLKRGDTKRWANDIRLLQEKDLSPRGNQSQDDIIKAMQSVLNNSDCEFFPVIESGNSFREKFLKIENFKKRKSKTSKVNGTDELLNDFINEK